VLLTAGQLHADQIQPSRVIHGLVIKRLVVTWILLSLVLGAVMVYREMDKIDSQAFSLAMNSSASLREHVTKAGDQHADSLKTAFVPLIRQGYLQAGVSNAEGQVMAEASVPDANELLARLKAHKNKPINLEAERHRVLWFGEGLVVLVHIPLFDQSNRYIGSFYGAY